MLLTDHSGNSYSLKKGEAYIMEISLNLSPYKWEWRQIGDKLYNYAIDKEQLTELVVTTEQFKYLIQLLSKDTQKHKSNNINTSK